MISSHFSYVGVCGILHTFLAYVYSILYCFHMSGQNVIIFVWVRQLVVIQILCYVLSIMSSLKLSIALISFMFCLTRRGGFDSFVFRSSMRRIYG